MSSAWNWVGILLWLVLIAYVLWLIANVHSRKKRTVRVIANRKTSGLAPDLFGRNARVTAIEIVILLVLGFVIGKATFRHHLTAQNSVEMTKCEPLDLTQTRPNRKHPHRKPHSYYLKINRSNSRSFKQSYRFTILGKKIKASDRNATVTTNPRQLTNAPTLPHRIQKLLKKQLNRSVDKRDHRLWVLRTATAYKNSLGNGIGLHAGQKKFYYTVIRLPKTSKSFVFVNNRKLHRKRVAKK